MKIQTVFLIFILALAFTFNVSAQDKTNINKSDETLLALKEKLTKLKLLVSTIKDVRKVFGKKNCRPLNICFFDKNWTVHIRYVSSQEVAEPPTKKTIYYRPRSKGLVGKLLGISVIGSKYRTKTLIKVL